MGVSMLRDLGERRILHDIIEKFFPPAPNALIPIGDDGAVISFGNEDDVVILTTDPCPVPVAWLLGDKDYYLFGWYSILINASDLAAMGATPIGVLLAVNAREDMKIDDFNRFLHGAADAANGFNCPVIGGNLKDADSFSCIGTAIGKCKRDNVLLRSTAKDSDLVVVIGDMGFFASAVLARLRGISLTQSEQQIVERSLLRPIARVREGQILANKRLANSCMDSSDGLANCFYEIALKSQMDIYLDFEKVYCEPVVSKVANRAGIDIRKLMLMWGDWQLVCTIPEDKINQLDYELRNLQTPYSIVGRTKSGTGKVLIRDGEEYKTLNKIDSERFSKASYFSHGIHTAFDLENIPLTM